MTDQILEIVNNIFTSLRNIALSVEEMRKEISDMKIDCINRKKECELSQSKFTDHLQEDDIKKKDGNGDGRTLKIRDSGCCLL